jgi:HD-GYP domain-containing protein (c-di-GMP phosphodiesterase class II)
MRRYLPLAVLLTTLVTIVPAVLVAAVAPRGNALGALLLGAAAVALSISIAAAGAAVWKRQPRSRDVLFADLLLWGWLRRWWTERRLSEARELYESACRAGPLVSIQLLTGLGRLLEARDSYTHGHGSRVARHSERIARAMHLSQVEVAKIRTAAAVHDLGKLYTPREILNNPGRLSDEEFEVVKRHAADGADMLAGVGDPEITAMVRHHHERIDGRGYPDGLAGAEIPLGARIIAVADTFDAITSNRAYRGAGTQKQALKVIAAGAGTQLDPAAVAAFRHRYSGRRSVAWLALVTAVCERGVIALQAASQGVGAAAGVTSLLPTLGAAGLFSLSPALGSHTPAALQRASAQPRSGPHVTVARPHGAPARHVASRPRGPAPTTRARPRAVAHITPVKPTARSLAPSSSRTSPPASTGGPAPAGSSPPPSAPSAPPGGPIRVPPVEVQAPPPQTPPSVPSAPPVAIPNVPVPPVPVPGLPIPPVKVVVGGVTVTG